MQDIMAAGALCAEGKKEGGDIMRCPRLCLWQYIKEIECTDYAKNSKEAKCKIRVRAKVACRKPIWLLTLIFWKFAVEIGDISGYDGEDQRNCC